MCNSFFKKRSEPQEVKPREAECAVTPLGERLKGRFVFNYLGHVLSMSCEPGIVWS